MHCLNVLVNYIIYWTKQKKTNIKNRKGNRMGVFHEYIEKFINTQVFVEIYTDRYEESHYGHIVKLSNQLLMIESFSGKDGQNNGVMIFKLQDITRIRWEGNEIQEMEKLAKQSTRRSSLSSIDITTINTAFRQFSSTFCTKHDLAPIFIQINGLFPGL